MFIAALCTRYENNPNVLATEKIIYLYNGILFLFKKERNSVTYDNIDKPGVYAM